MDQAAGVQKLNAKIIEISKTEDMIARMRAINVVVPVQTPDEMRAYMAEDTKRNADLIKAAENARPKWEAANTAC